MEVCLLVYAHLWVCAHNIKICGRCSVSVGRKGATMHSLKKVCQFAYFIYPWVAIPSNFFLTSLCNSVVKRQAKNHIHMHEKLLKQRFFFSKLNHEDHNRKRRKHFFSTELLLSTKILCAFVTNYMLIPAVLEGIEVCQVFLLICTCGTSSCFSKGTSNRQNRASWGKD